ncbi:GFA family protein [Sandaracinobacteroides saxicola]|uniref:GFA family protein n=1 Tax=Sandaracinobacteroides saxicola TaxID=2759707 RepID=A0A7G5IL26_9SPHN|nr:GFA family protein [Sandaracinobacteroides saxicola]QMW24068.1 GFA family protein [Sandaracinobacteroides saxicola]
MSMEGGCQCGAVRYVLSGAVREAYWCHCRMCQRATGNVAAAFANVAKAELSVTGTITHFMSSPFGRRGFCAACGTPLTFDYLDSARIDLTVGSLDDPAALRPNAPHFGVESRVPGWIPPDGLPEMRSTDYAPLCERWAKVSTE